MMSFCIRRSPLPEKPASAQARRSFPFASIGHPPQDQKYAGETSELIIGAHNVIREHVTMNPGTVGGGMVTRVGDNGLFMAGAHVAHDCQVGNHVILANHATLAGHVMLVISPFWAACRRCSSSPVSAARHDRRHVGGGR